ncbi:formate hydrogenlyase subunit 6/NADH:ubiquinone oxidoreductase subunit I [Anaerobacterium chartisolvens]|uniref:Formate hydrogenlyase subunit 6/NADH:ubiquinone oxidoreductase subunit I n=1 Tax=Anaerobacterium chartisolvens TaxID=1297424 RepID=A0A369AVW4_9FIRM|nr:4Fe-4S binding protein [Anaerobacterium chartisolvens]RCX12357.1 formate hydrogenlyase subunit 6/NADH:ubiquinone oxidoreductase subunit I [Anaerobacterium chartisolvens]
MFDMISNIFKNLSSKPATRKYPFEKRETFKDSRGSVKGVDIDTCIFCGICARKCPSDAIAVDRNSKSWEIDPFKCVVCGVCAEVCPKKCLFMDEQYSASAYSKGKNKFVQQPKPAEEEPGKVSA